MFYYFVIFILFFCKKSVLSEEACPQATDAKIPENINTIEEIAKYADEGINCIRLGTINDVQILFENLALEIEKIYEELIKTENTYHFIETINSIEIFSIENIMGLVIDKVGQKRIVLDAAAVAIQAKDSGTKYESQIKLLEEVGKTQLNNVFLVANTAVMKLISARNSYAVQIKRLLDCNFCGNTVPYVKKLRSQEENWRVQLFTDTIQHVNDYEQAISDVLAGFQSS